MNTNLKETLESISRLIEDIDMLDGIRKLKNNKNQCKIAKLTWSLRRLEKRGYITSEYHPLSSRPSESYYLITLLTK